MNLPTKSKKEEGFTLIEMLIAIVILSVLLGIATLGFSGARRASYVNSCKVEFAAVESAINSYRNDNPRVTGLSPGDPLLDLYSDAPGSLSAQGYMVKLDTSNRQYYSLSLNWIAAGLGIVGQPEVKVLDSDGTEIGTTPTSCQSLTARS